MERHIMTWQREHSHDGLHPLFDDILRRQLLLPRSEPKPAPSAENADREILRLPTNPKTNPLA